MKDFQIMSFMGIVKAARSRKQGDQNGYGFITGSLRNLSFTRSAI